ncbi:ABC transporter ATP-binding protein [Ruthenibacterium lactatiformans]|uniref:ABC transporter ATP-binding protein n=1 Tax=Ruthenibacterium lactatiformans TaxID=1550024 RepID=UPI0029426EE6|nr:ABC transporter ATP-binding protein [Ruthenibacterium lactatiformans]
MEKQQNSMATPALLRRFWPYMARYKGILCFDLFCAALTSVCELVLPLIMRSITNMGVNDLSSLTVSYILRVGALYLVLRLIDGAANYFMANTGHVMGARIETDMRRDAFDHLQKLSDSYFANTKVGQIMGRITNDLFDVTEFAHHCPEEFFIAGLKGVISFIILAGMNVWLTLIVFAVVPVMVICCTRFNHMVRATFLKQRRHIGELNARIEDSLLGERVVKAFGGEDLEREKFEQDNGRFLDIKKETYRWMAAFNTTTRLFDGLMYLVVIVAGGLFMLYGKIEPGDLVAYMLYVTTLLSTIRRIIEFAEQFQRGMTGIERFCEIMDADVDIFDDENAKPLENVQGRITFEHVSFEYPDDHNKVLHDLSLDVRPGEKLALVGPSGGGKTTLCNLIPRFYDATSGHVRIDGRDVKTVTLESLRRAIGIVQQDVYLFSGTVYENILYGRPDATRAEVEQAAKLAGAHEFISALHSGYDTYVGERGVKLSGGQKQRISIARVFLKNPPILILDEATSALDNESEHLVGQSLARLAQGRTTLTIAHRLTTIQHADRILVLGENGIEEEGTHEELLAKHGVYHKLWTGAAALDKPMM